jgi:hypothetical protein
MTASRHGMLTVALDHGTPLETRIWTRKVTVSVAS